MGTMQVSSEWCTLREPQGRIVHAWRKLNADLEAGEGVAWKNIPHQTKALSSRQFAAGGDPSPQQRQPIQFQTASASGAESHCLLWASPQPSDAPLPGPMNFYFCLSRCSARNWGPTNQGQHLWLRAFFTQFFHKAYSTVRKTGLADNCRYWQMLTCMVCLYDPFNQVQIETC